MKLIKAGSKKQGASKLVAYCGPCSHLGPCRRIGR